MVNLMLHCGAHHVERQELEQAPTPDRTKTWVPIAHQTLLHQVETTLVDDGMTIVNQSHALWGDGARYFGLLEITNGTPTEDYSLVVGLRNSHDKSFPAALVLGSSVFCCDNLAFSGEVKLSRRHTVFIERDLPGLVQRAVGQLADCRLKQDQRIETYKQKRLTNSRAHDLMIRAVDARVLPVTQLPRVLDEWRRPSHKEFVEGGQTAWRLFNAFTETLKGRNLVELPRRTQALHGLMDTACGLVGNPKDN